METPFPDRSLDKTQREISVQGFEILTNVNSEVQEVSGVDNLGPQLIEPSQISKGHQALTENFEKKSNDRIMKKREELDNKSDAMRF